MNEIEIRPCRTIDEMNECVTVQAEVWGFQSNDIIPRRMFVVAGKVGGQVIGAFDGTKMAGFAMAIPGIKNRSAYLHSHMLAVREPYRDAGIGRRLKLAQRDEAMSRGITLMEWTFDPLELKNAFLNIVRLGAIVRRYTRSFYGNTSSTLQAGLPTDRLHAEWWLASQRVKSHIAGQPGHSEEIRRIVVPAEVAEWKRTDATRDRARAVQARVADEFESAFNQGLAITGFHREETDGVYSLGEVMDHR